MGCICAVDSKAVDVLLLKCIDGRSGSAKGSADGMKGACIGSADGWYESPNFGGMAGEALGGGSIQGVKGTCGINGITAGIVGIGCYSGQGFGG